jgi:hypothetical protein
LSKVDNGDGFSTFTMDFSGCKNEDISWACCVASDGTNQFCEIAQGGCVNAQLDSSDSENGHKCETLSIVSMLVPSDATSVLINTHDGATYNGIPLEQVNTAVCGGNANEGGGCVDLGGTAYCANIIDINDCGDESTCVDQDCPAADPEDPCDRDDYCQDGTCCDNRYTGGYVFKCSRTAYLCGPPNLASFECNIGNRGVTEVVHLEYPACIGTGTVQLDELCLNNHGLSNFARGECTSDGEGNQFWTCDEDVDKVEIDDNEGIFPIPFVVTTGTGQCLDEEQEMIIQTDSTRHLRGPEF